MISSGTNLQFYSGALNGEFGVVRSNSNSTESYKRLGSVMDDLESLKSIASSRRRTEDAKPQLQGVSSSDAAGQPDYSSNPDPRFPPPDTPAPMRFKPKQCRRHRQQHGPHSQLESQVQ